MLWRHSVSRCFRDCPVGGEYSSSKRECRKDEGDHRGLSVPGFLGQGLLGDEFGGCGQGRRDENTRYNALAVEALPRTRSQDPCPALP